MEERRRHVRRHRDQGSTGSGDIRTQGRRGDAGAVGSAVIHRARRRTSGSGASKVDQAKPASRTSSARRRKSARPGPLADRLDAGAEKPSAQARMRCSGAAARAAASRVASDDRMAQVNDSVARGMHKSADWLRNGDLKADVERQVRDNLAAPCSSRSAWDTCSVRHSATIGRSAYGHSRRQWAVASSRCAPARARRGQHVADPAGGAARASS